MRLSGAWARTGAAKSAPISALDRPCEYAYNGTASHVMPRPKFQAAEATKKDACCTPHYRRRRVSARRAFRPTHMRIALLIVVTALVPVLARAAACTARSPAHTVAFVELYTSEGCNSCPPADRWLSGIAKAYPRERVVPLALHVDYWDYIGW